MASIGMTRVHLSTREKIVVLSFEKTVSKEVEDALRTPEGRTRWVAAKLATKQAEGLCITADQVL